MARDGIACRILNRNKQLEQVDTFPYLESLIGVIMAMLNCCLN